MMAKTSRVKNSIYNGLSGLFINLSVTVLSFVVRTFFIKYLGEQNLGLEGLFTNLLSLLSLAELGFEAAISFSLYEPIAKNNTKKINALMCYFKKIYQRIGVVVFVLGLIVLPFLSLIVKGYTVNGNVYLFFLLYLINTVSSYYTSYVGVLLAADQKNYRLTWIKLIFNILVYSSQLFLIVTFKSFVLYLVVQFILRFIERIVTYKFIKNSYPNIDLKNNYDLDKKEKEKIKTNLKGIIYHKVGDYAVNGTDNILISSLVNISTTGIYTNYLSIVSIVRNLIGSVISATTASFGNLNVEEKAETKKNAFEIVNFICILMTGFSVVGLYFCINPFISMWVGEKYMLDNLCVIVICVNFYLNNLMHPITAVKNSAGLYYVDRFVPLIQALINLSVSIILGVKYGLIGILLGTSISSILTVNITKPYVIYKYVFNDSSLTYFKNLIKQILIVLVSIFISNSILNLISINNSFIQFIVYGLISVCIFSVLFVILNFYRKEFKYVMDLIVSKIRG